MLIPTNREGAPALLSNSWPGSRKLGDGSGSGRETRDMNKILMFARAYMYIILYYFDYFIY